MVTLKETQAIEYKKCQINNSKGAYGALIDGRCGVQNQCGHEAIPKIVPHILEHFIGFRARKTHWKLVRFTKKSLDSSHAHLLLEVFGMVLEKEENRFLEQIHV